MFTIKMGSPDCLIIMKLLCLCSLKLCSEFHGLSLLFYGLLFHVLLLLLCSLKHCSELFHGLLLPSKLGRQETFIFWLQGNFHGSCLIFKRLSWQETLIFWLQGNFHGLCLISNFGDDTVIFVPKMQSQGWKLDLARLQLDNFHVHSFFVSSTKSFWPASKLNSYALLILPIFEMKHPSLSCFIIYFNVHIRTLKFMYKICSFVCV